MSKYKVVTPVDHDGKRYEPSSSIELTKDQAEPLLAIGAVAQPGKANEEKSNEVDPPKT